MRSRLRFFSTLQQETLSGSVARVIFRSDKTGFTVIKMNVTGSGKKRHLKRSAVVLGFSRGVIEGEYIEATGQWEQDEKYGTRLKAESIRQVLPTSGDNAEKYLTTFKGIGPKFAARVVAAFPGESIFDVMEKQPSRLLKVPGVGKKKLQSIFDEFKTKQATQDITLFLQECGIGAALTEQLLNTYGGMETAKLVRSNPYALPLSFRHADKIGTNVGIEPSNQLRLRRAVSQAVRDGAFQGGHCCLKAQSALRLASKLVGEYDMEDALKAEMEAGRLVGVEREEQLWVYPPELYEAERGVVEHLTRIKEGEHPLPWVNTERMVSWAEESASMKLAPMQAEAVRKALTSKVLLITGGPGVGKTQTIATIVQVFTKMMLPCVLASPTGRASARLAEFTGTRALTLHRLLDYDSTLKVFKRNAENPLLGSLFLIDEVSMMDVQLAHAFLQAVPTNGVVILVGDVNQLPSVSPGNVLQDAIRSQQFPTVELTRIFRQHQHMSSIVEEAYRLLHGEVPKIQEYDFKKSFEELTEESDLRFVHAPSQHDTVNAITALVKQLPNAMDDVQVLTPMRRGLVGSRHLNTVLQGLLNPRKAATQRSMTYGSSEFRAGDKVMQVINDRDKNVYNGEIGRVSYIHKDNKALTVEYAESKMVTYDREALGEILPSYAITIHKSQGSEFPVVILPIISSHSIMLERHLLYTGMTRSRRLTIIVGTQSALKMATEREAAMQRNSFLKEMLLERKQ